jgi:DNA-binding MarR family transcriptional regulator
VELHLTDAGKTLMQELYPKFNAIEAQVVGDLSSKRKHDMVTSLRTIVTTIEDVEGVAEPA